MSSRGADKFEKVQIAFIALFALGTAFGPLVVSPLTGVVVLLVALGVASGGVVVAMRCYGALRGGADGVMGTEEWGYAGIIGCLFLIAQKVMFFADPVYQLTGNVSPIFDVIMVGLVGAIAAVLIFAGTWVAGSRGAGAAQ